MAGVHLPQHREQRLVRQQRLPQRLEPQRLGEAAQHVLAEVVGEHPLPRVELEHRGDRRFLEVDEPVERDVPADVLDRQPDGVEPGLGRGLLQVADGDVVLAGGVAAPDQVKWTSAPGSRPPDLAATARRASRAGSSTGRRRGGCPSASSTAGSTPRAAWWGCRRCTPAAWPGRRRRSGGRSGRRRAGRCRFHDAATASQRHSGSAKSRNRSVVTTWSTASRHIECSTSTSASSERTSSIANE